MVRNRHLPGEASNRFDFRWRLFRVINADVEVGIRAGRSSHVGATENNGYDARYLRELLRNGFEQLELRGTQAEGIDHHDEKSC
jgi:hypothetical protein